jgi:hypothetical protein
MTDKKCQCGQSHEGTSFPTAGPGFSRRQFFRIAGTSLAGYYFTKVARPLEVLAASKAQTLDTARFCIFVFLSGGPTHVDTFDLKEGAWTPSDFAPETYNGIRFPRGLMPTLADQLQHITIARSVLAWAAVHSLAQNWAQIARNPTGALGNISPHIGAVVALETEAQRKPDDVLPGFLALGGTSVGAGYLSAKYGPFAAQPNGTNGLAGLTHPDGQARFDRRWQLIQTLDAGLRDNSPLGKPAEDMADFYDQAKVLMYNPTVDSIFKFTTEEQARYGKVGAANGNAFGDACIVARNLVKADKGARFIQLSLGGWDHHSNIYAANSLYNRCQILDLGLGNLIKDLAATPSPRASGKTLLDETLIVTLGEFGRTVGNTNNQGGRDHFLRQFIAFAGGGVKGGRAIGTTDAQGNSVTNYGWSADRDIRIEDATSSIYSAMGIDWTTIRYDDPIGRGFEYVPFAAEGLYQPVLELF